MHLKRNWAKVLAVTRISTAVVSVALRAQRAGTPSLGRRGIAQTVGDFFIERLPEWGDRRIAGYPGDGINGVFGAPQRGKGKIEFVQCRHEEMAAFMASAHAKFTGERGVCIATSGPGASHLVTGL
jgi:hypothetical protein